MFFCCIQQCFIVFFPRHCNSFISGCAIQRWERVFLDVLFVVLPKRFERAVLQSNTLKCVASASGQQPGNFPPPEIFRTCFVVRYNKLQSFFPLRNSTASYNHFASPQNYQPGAAVVCLMLFLCIMTGSKWLFQIFLPLSYLQTNVHLGAYFVFPVEASVSGITIFFIHSHTY